MVSPDRDDATMASSQNDEAWPVLVVQSLKSLIEIAEMDSQVVSLSVKLWARGVPSRSGLNSILMSCDTAPLVSTIARSKLLFSITVPVLFWTTKVRLQLPS